VDCKGAQLKYVLLPLIVIVASCNEQKKVEVYPHSQTPKDSNSFELAAYNENLSFRGLRVFEDILRSRVFEKEVHIAELLPWNARGFIPYMGMKVESMGRVEERNLRVNPFTTLVWTIVAEELSKRILEACDEDSPHPLYPHLKEVVCHLGSQGEDLELLSQLWHQLLGPDGSVEAKHVFLDAVWPTYQNLTPKEATYGALIALLSHPQLLLEH
jgi:hypothetical protein